MMTMMLCTLCLCCALRPSTLCMLAPHALPLAPPPTSNHTVRLAASHLCERPTRSTLCTHAFPTALRPSSDCHRARCCHGLVALQPLGVPSDPEGALHVHMRLSP